MTPAAGLQTSIPPVPETTIARDRLFHQLEAGLKRPLTLVSAPAGYGKTVLVAHWLRTTHTPALWLTVEEKEPGLPQFWQQVMTVLRTLASEIGEEALEILRQESTPPIETILARLLADIERWGQSLCLVLDDYFHIQSAPIHQSVRFLLEHCPANFHLIVLTRVDPPLPLARYRARGQLAEIRADDLSLTESEVQALLQELGAASLSAGALRLLHQRTEGWAAGIHLSALALQKQPDPEAFIAALSGNQRYIFDYLADEVLSALSEDEQALFLKTSILRQFNGALAEVLAGPLTVPIHLEQIYRQNIFLQAVDEAREWFRYHALFRDVLQYRLKRAYSPDDIRQLHGRASAWYQQAGWGQEALHHALAAEDYARAGALLETMPELLTWSSGFHADLIPTLEMLPAAVIGARPRLQVLFARALLLDGQAPEALRRLETLEAQLGGLGLPEAESRAYTGMILTHRATHLALRGDVAQAEIAAKQALENLAPADELTRAQAIHTLGLAADSQGQVRPAADYYRQASRHALRADHRSLAVTAASQQAFAEIALGALRQAEATARQALQWATIGRTELPVAAYPHVALAEVLRQQNRVSLAEQEILRATALGGKAMPTVRWHAALVQAQICFSQHNLGQAQTILQQSEIDFQHSLPAHFSENTRALLCQVWVAQGRPELAQDWLGSVQTQLARPAFESPSHAARAVILCQARLAAGQKEQAREPLKAVYAFALQHDQKALVIQVLCLLALSAENQAAALAYLQEALALAEPQGYHRTFLDEGPAVLDLLQMLRQSATAPTPFLLELLEAGRQEWSTPAAGRPATPSDLEPLTERELEVLAQIARGASNQEIAHRLVVSIHTVKKHAANIFLKLGVENRTEAVDRARSLGWL